MNSSKDVRTKIVDALELDCVGPRPGLGDPAERLRQSPSRWYLTGFLVPANHPAQEPLDPDADDDLDVSGEAGLDDDSAPERTAGRQRKYPNSIGLSFLVAPEEAELTATARWGDYVVIDPVTTRETWSRKDRCETVTLPLQRANSALREVPVPNSNGLSIGILVRPVSMANPDAGLPSNTRAVSVFLINRRTPMPDERRDEGYAFQASLSIAGQIGFVPKPDLRSIDSNDEDELLADLQYRDARELASGHNVATRAESRFLLATRWIPSAEIERVEPGELAGEFQMDVLAGITSYEEARVKLVPIVESYRAWITAQRGQIPDSPQRRKDTAEALLGQAEYMAGRMERGIAVLEDDTCREAFCLANGAMAAAARQRLGVMRGLDPAGVQPRWRPFQLAFLLLNLEGIAEPASTGREVVDLLFFPTGGGKTEAYLGLAAFTLLLRRMRNPGVAGAGLSVLMRYTLRLLTLDQLGRASTLICALELLRRKQPERLGTWPFEIGLWVGSAATPNIMGSKDRDYPDTAYRKTRNFQNKSSSPSPIPIEECPWCGRKFSTSSFRLWPNPDYPVELRVRCADFECVFSRELDLPIIAVDEQIYRRLPCFVIATVDKFAALPWTGNVGALFGRVDRHDKDGFYGPADSRTYGTPLAQRGLPPPDLIIQDELHLISGPLGTIAGLYETAIENLCTREVDGKTIRPKIVASTATVRRATDQIRALFNRMETDVFPPPGPDRLDSCFAKTVPSEETPARLYVGVAAQGRSQKVVMLRVYRALLAAAQKLYADNGGSRNKNNPADPYMTLLGYFNALRELGGSRRLVEGEVRNQISRYSERRRVGETDPPFANREIGIDPVELTSRVRTDQVAQYKRNLALPFHDKHRVDVALATNMISVGLDIPRLGLMVVYGQPKGSAEYIQATSRVGREKDKPGLVVTLLNIHKPRDRSHYERFAHFHETFYRSVEATSVTPFSPRAMDRALAATVVGFARHRFPSMTPALGAMRIHEDRLLLDAVVETIAERAYHHRKNVDPPEDRDRLRAHVRNRVLDLLEEWSKLVSRDKIDGIRRQYNPTETGDAKGLLQNYLDPNLKTLPRTDWRIQFRANRSMRDVEPSVDLWVQTIDRLDVDGGD